MADFVRVPESDWQAICDAVREKTGSAETMKSGKVAVKIGETKTPTEPYVEYTLDADGNVTEAALYGFTHIPEYMFAYQTKLTNVDISNSPSLTSIGACAFQDCTALSYIALPEGLTSIGDNAFYSCTSLALTSLPEGLTSIGSSAFRGCTSLALTSLPEGLTSIGSSAFYNCTGLVHMEVNATALGIGTKIFGNCTGLIAVWIRSTCSTITATSAKNAPFVGCSTSLAIYAEDTAMQSGWDMYFNCTGSSGGTTVTVTYGQTESPWAA